jgi:hypothetical protein
MILREPGPDPTAEDLLGPGKRKTRFLPGIQVSDPENSGDRDQKGLFQAETVGPYPTPGAFLPEPRWRAQPDSRRFFPLNPAWVLRFWTGPSRRAGLGSTDRATNHVKRPRDSESLEIGAGVSAPPLLDNAAVGH